MNAIRLRIAPEGICPDLAATLDQEKVNRRVAKRSLRLVIKIIR